LEDYKTLKHLIAVNIDVSIKKILQEAVLEFLKGKVNPS